MLYWQRKQVYNDKLTYTFNVILTKRLDFLCLNQADYPEMTIFALLEYIIDRLFVTVMSILEILALAAGILGIVGSIVPGLPGPPVSWVGLLLVFINKSDGGHPVTVAALLVWLAIMVVVTILDYIVPAKFTRMTGGTKAASRGALLGLVVGLLLPPLGMIVGSLLGAFLAELFSADKDIWGSAKASLGAFLGFLFGTGMKLVASGMMMYYIVVAIW